MKIRFSAAGFAALALCASTPALAQEKSATRPGFVLNGHSVRIVLMRPVVRVGAQSAGGVVTPHADWTVDARVNIGRALRAEQASLGNVVVDYDEGASGEGAVASQYERLFGVIAESVIEYQFFAGNRLPTKKRKGQFEWGVGDGLSRLKSLEGADYALFIDTYDAYGSAGRKLLQITGMIAGVGVTSGVHQGHAGLIDLKTGELVWLNADRAMGGDVRDAEGARKRVQELLKGFPGHAAEPVPAQ